jgi:hypothetical protein
VFFKMWNYTYSQMYAPAKAAMKEGRKNGGAFGAMQELTEVMWGTAYAKTKYGIRTGIGHKAIFTYVIPAMAMALLTRGRPPEDEDEFFGDLLMYSLMTVPLFGPALSGSLMWNSYKRDASPIHLAGLNDLKEVVRNYSLGDKEAMARAGTNLAAKSFGFPSTVLRIVRGLREGDYQLPNGNFSEPELIKGIMRWDKNLK